MQSTFTLSEMVINSVAMGKKMYIKDDDGNLVMKIIDYVKLLKYLRLAQIHFDDGVVIEVSEDDEMLFEVNSKKAWSRGSVKRLKGIDVWGAEEIER
jgi:hypothetical protein